MIFLRFICFSSSFVMINIETSVKFVISKSGREQTCTFKYFLGLSIHISLSAVQLIKKHIG
jgi:hypothetical protein